MEEKKKRTTAITMRERYGDDYYSNIGRKGGQNGHTCGFASNKVGKDGLTGPERARIAGFKGGLKSRKGKKKTNEDSIISSTR